MNPSITPPPGAVFFKLDRLNEVRGKNKETGKSFRSPRKEKLYGDPGKEGELAEQWAVAEFSVKDIAKRFGGGRYVVTWLDGSGKRIASRTFVLSSPAVGPSRLRPKDRPAEDDDDERPSRRARNDIGQLGTFDLIAMLDERADRAAQREKERADAQRDTDRQFTGLMMQMMTQLVASPARAAQAAGPAVDMTREMQLLRREINVTIQEQMAGVRQSVASMLDDSAGSDNDDDDLPVPKNVSQAVEQVGISILREATSAAPDFVRELLPAFLKGLRARGVKPSPELLAKMRMLKEQERMAKAIADQYRVPNGTPPAPGDPDEEEEEPDDLDDANPS